MSIAVIIYSRHLSRWRHTQWITFVCEENQCCQLNDFVARFNEFSDPFSDFFFFKAPSDKSSDFWKNLSNFPNVASTVLRAGDLELHLSLCLLWSVSAGSGWEEQHIEWPHGSWHGCEWAAHVHTVLPRNNHLPASPLFEIKLFNLTVFSSFFFFFFVNSSHALILLTVTEL